MKTCLIRDIEWENYFLKMIILWEALETYANIRFRR